MRTHPPSVGRATRVGKSRVKHTWCSELRTCYMLWSVFCLPIFVSKRNWTFRTVRGMQINIFEVSFCLKNWSFCAKMWKLSSVVKIGVTVWCCSFGHVLCFFLRQDGGKGWPCTSNICCWRLVSNTHFFCFVLISICNFKSQSLFSQSFGVNYR